jgi:FixJ family two-component response regulator
MQVECRVFASAEEFLRSPAWESPGCLVMEFRLLGMNGLELQRELTNRGSRLPVIFMSTHPETRLTIRAMRLGAITVLEKPVSKQELWDAIREAFSRNGELRRIDAAHEEIQGKLDSLSLRERQVLRLVMAGKNEQGNFWKTRCERSYC